MGGCSLSRTISASSCARFPGLAVALHENSDSLYSLMGVLGRAVSAGLAGGDESLVEHVCRLVGEAIAHPGAGSEMRNAVALSFVDAHDFESTAAGHRAWERLMPAVRDLLRTADEREGRVSVNATRAIAKVHAVPDSWVRVDRVDRLRGGLRLHLGVCQGRGGPVVAEWVLTCRGIRETKIDDLDGGGLQLWDAGHPAVRQYTDAVVRLRCSPPDLRSALGVLFEAHAAAVDDWIPFDRYLGLELPAPAKVLRLRGPRFLMERYARALRKAGVPAVVKGQRTPRKGSAPLRVLHFGSSYVIARVFDMQKRTGSPGERRVAPDGRGDRTLTSRAARK